VSQYDIDLMIDAEDARKEQARKVTIHRVEVADKDPDRWVKGLAERFGKSDPWHDAHCTCRDCELGQTAIADDVFSDEDEFERPRLRLSFFEVAFVLYCHALALALLGSSC
jgi:hypothetical protein